MEKGENIDGRTGISTVFQILVASPVYTDKERGLIESAGCPNSKACRDPSDSLSPL